MVLSHHVGAWNWTGIPCKVKVNKHSLTASHLPVPPILSLSVCCFLLILPWIVSVLSYATLGHALFLLWTLPNFICFSPVFLVSNWSKSLAEQEPYLSLCYTHSTCTVWHLSRGEVRQGWHTVGFATLVSCRKSIHKIVYGRECSHSN